MIFVDTGMLIGNFLKGDQHHNRSVEIFKELLESGETLLISESILSEVATYLSRAKSPEIASHATAQLLTSNRVEIVLSTETDLKIALELLRKFDLESYADANTMQLMDRLKVNRIASFDSDFDRNPKIKRVK